jgi:Zn-dependent protease
MHWSLPALGYSFSFLPAISDSRISIPASFGFVTLALVLLLLIHELGHALVAISCSVQVTGIFLSGFGGLCCVAALPSSRSGRLMLHAAGFIAQALALAAAVGVIWLVGAPKSLWATCFAFVFIGINAVVLIVSLLPVVGNDAYNFLAELRGHSDA